ncbi:PTS system N-acetylglucosamine-specific IIA component, Glc family [Paraoerskovia marina]|uniref:PTS system N-acetylglucosamine-specific IIA component, Glc family n=1 Tax=Paraoerskovia marina TaxID=545619 RepID=A0A1H1U9G9_9CELL|nr:PTS system N-acetylglucosamine-specific IIA component, Glc family [Paraoerskovia marina]
MQVTIGSPLAGVVVPLATVPDPVFAQEIVGPGVAVEPEGSDPVVVCAPVSGRVASLFPHAFAIQIPEGQTVLVHLGIDTVRLDGHGFDLQVAVGDVVEAGAPLIVWDASVTRAEGLATVCPVVALQGDPAHVGAAIPLGSSVTVGEPIVTWSLPSTRTTAESPHR